MAIPAMTPAYGKPDWMDQYKQKQAQGYTITQPAILAAEYGDRFAELTNQFNMQKYNRDLALKEYEINLNNAYRNRQLDINKDTSDKAFYGQLAGTGAWAISNYDKIAGAGKSIWNAGKGIWEDWNADNSPIEPVPSGDYGPYGEDTSLMYGGSQYVDTGPAFSSGQDAMNYTGDQYLGNWVQDSDGNWVPPFYGDEGSVTPGVASMFPMEPGGINISGGQSLAEWGRQFLDTGYDPFGEAALSGVDAFGDGSMAFLDYGAELYDPMMTGVDAAMATGDIASGAMDAASMSVPYFALAKYGTKALNEFAQANDIQAIKNFTEPLTGMFDAFSTTMGEFFTGLFDLF